MEVCECNNDLNKDFLDNGKPNSLYFVEVCAERPALRVLGQLGGGGAARPGQGVARQPRPLRGGRPALRGQTDHLQR